MSHEPCKHKICSWQLHSQLFLWLFDFVFGTFLTAKLYTLPLKQSNNEKSKKYPFPDEYEDEILRSVFIWKTLQDGINIVYVRGQEGTLWKSPWITVSPGPSALFLRKTQHQPANATLHLVYGWTNEGNTHFGPIEVTSSREHRLPSLQRCPRNFR